MPAVDDHVVEQTLILLATLGGEARVERRAVAGVGGVLEVAQQVGVFERVARLVPVVEPRVALRHEALVVGNFHEAVRPSFGQHTLVVEAGVGLDRHVDVKLCGDEEERRTAHLLNVAGTAFGRGADIFVHPVGQDVGNLGGAQVAVVVAVEQDVDGKVFAVFVEEEGHLAALDHLVEVVGDVVCLEREAGAGTGEVDQVVVLEDVLVYFALRQFGAHLGLHHGEVVVFGAFQKFLIHLKHHLAADGAHHRLVQSAYGVEGARGCRDIGVGGLRAACAVADEALQAFYAHDGVVVVEHRLDGQIYLRGKVDALQHLHEALEEGREAGVVEPQRGK